MGLRTYCEKSADRLAKLAPKIQQFLDLHQDEQT